MWPRGGLAYSQSSLQLQLPLPHSHPDLPRDDIIIPKVCSWMMPRCVHDVLLHDLM
jgi:hypothetical protein